MNQNELLEALLKADTPTACNALEIVMGGRSAQIFTKGPVIPIDPKLPAFVGYAVTARL